MTYAEFENKIENLLKVKLTNYRMTSNDIFYLIDLVYDEIVNEVILGFYEQEVVLLDDIYTYDLDALYTPTGDEQLGTVLSITTEDGYLMNTWRRVKDNVWKHDKLYEECSLIDSEILSVFFTREIRYGINELPSDLYIKLLPVVLDGIMYHTHDAIPNPTSSGFPVNESNVYYNKYKTSMALLKNKLPQRK